MCLWVVEPDNGPNINFSFSFSFCFGFFFRFSLYRFKLKAFRFFAWAPHHVGCPFDLPPFHSISLSLPSYTLSLLLSSISSAQHFSCLPCISHTVFPLSGSPVISLFIFTGVFTNFPSISSLSVALNQFSCVLRVFFCSFFGF